MTAREPIETAPFKKFILIWHDDFGWTIAERWPEIEGWFESWSGELITNFQPTHWMHLPDAPTQGADQEHHDNTRDNTCSHFSAPIAETPVCVVSRSGSEPETY